MKKEGLILERDLEEMVLIDKDDVNDERLLDIISRIFSLVIVFITGGNCLWKNNQLSVSAIRHVIEEK